MVGPSLQTARRVFRMVRPSFRTLATVFGWSDHPERGRRVALFHNRALLDHRRKVRGNEAHQNESVILYLRFLS